MTESEATLCRGFPFLVGRGRDRGHRVLMAADFLVSSDSAYVLEAATADLDAVEPHVFRLDSPAETLTVVCRRYRVRADCGQFLTGPAALATDTDLGCIVTDAFGRPIEVLAGFVARVRVGLPIDNEDLTTSERSAAQRYMRFLCDESNADVSSSAAFALKSKCLTSDPDCTDDLSGSDQPGPSDDSRPNRVRQRLRRYGPPWLMTFLAGLGTGLVLGTALVVIL